MSLGITVSPVVFCICNPLQDWGVFSVKAERARVGLI